MIAASLGNTELLKLRKTAFLCSRDIPASVVLKCYDWAIEQRNLGNCVISGFHSKIEKDVFHYLLAGTQPIIMAPGRGLKNKIEPGIQQAIAAGRLLIVTPFSKEVTRVTAATAEIRNRFMITMAAEVVIGYAKEGGMLDKLLTGIAEKKVYRIVA
jgi:hypothetical protein